jgi:hypothetical protein
MIRTKADLARRLAALKVGDPLYDFGFLLPRLFGRDGKLDKRGLEAARAFVAQHHCVLSYPEFIREPVIFEKLPADDILAAMQRFCLQSQQIGGTTESGH